MINPSKRTLTLPTVICASDYHEFKYIQNILNEFGVKVKYIEVGDTARDGQYHAVFYQGSQIDPKNKKLIADAKKQYTTREWW